MSFDPSDCEVDFPGNEVAGFVYEECGAVIDVSWPLLFSLFDVPVKGAGLSLAGERNASYGFFDPRRGGTSVSVDLFVDADSPANRGLWAAFGVRGPGDRRRLVWCPEGDELDVLQALFDTTGLCCVCRSGECPGYRILAGHIAQEEVTANEPRPLPDGGRRLSVVHGNAVFAHFLRLGPPPGVAVAEAG